MTRLSLFALAMLFSVSAVQAGEPGVNGTWTGSMRQVDVDRESRYPMKLHLSGAKGETDYPELQCGGTLTRVAMAQGGYTIYRETIVRGAFSPEKNSGCIDGLLIVTPKDGKLILGWFSTFEGTPSLASAELTRAAL